MRLKALQKWKSLFAFNATYRVLLGALLESGSTEQAFQVCRLLNPNQGVQSRPGVPTLEPYEPDSIGQALVPSSSPRSTGASGEYNCGHQTIVDCSEKIIAGLSEEPKSMALVLHGKGFISTETLREVTELPTTKTDNATKLYLSILETVQHHPHRYSEFISILRGNTLLYSDLLKVLEETYQAEQVHRFESRFHDLQKSALDEVTERGVTVKDFRQTLMTLPNTISKQHELFIKEKYSIFKQAELIEDIFLHLNFYLSFIDFSLLEHIIRHFGSPGLQQKMKQYSRDMEIFRTETAVADIIPHLSGRPKPPPHFARLKMKLNFDPKTCTLEDLEQHRKRLGGEFSLSKFALFLVEIGEGSLVEVYLVPSDIVPSLKDLVQTKSLTFFLNLEILKLSVNEECLYPFSTPKRGLASGSSSSQPTSARTEIGSQTSISEQSTSSAAKLEEGYTRSRQRRADEITSTIESTPDSRGLVIVVERNRFFHRYAYTFKKHLKFAVYEIPKDEEDMRDTIYAASHLVEYPKSSDYCIVVMVESFVADDVNEILFPSHFNISRDLIEPFLPHSAPVLADIPKIFFITIGGSPIDTSMLSVPPEGNFLVSYTTSRWFLDYEIVEHLHHELKTSRHSIGDVLSEVKGRYPSDLSMTVISHLEKPVYLHPAGPLDPIHTGEVTTAPVKDPLIPSSASGEQSQSSSPDDV